MYTVIHTQTAYVTNQLNSTYSNPADALCRHTHTAQKRKKENKKSSSYTPYIRAGLHPRNYNNKTDKKETFLLFDTTINNLRFLQVERDVTSICDGSDWNGCKAYKRFIGGFVITWADWRLWIEWRNRDGRAWYVRPSGHWVLRSHARAHRYRCRLAKQVPPVRKKKRHCQYYYDSPWE